VVYVPFVFGAPSRSAAECKQPDLGNVKPTFAEWVPEFGKTSICEAEPWYCSWCHHSEPVRVERNTQNGKRYGKVLPFPDKCPSCGLRMLNSDWPLPQN